MNQRLLLVLLSCLVPLAALGATVFLNAPVVPTVLVALASLAPIGYRLLSAPPGRGPSQGPGVRRR